MKIENGRELNKLIEGSSPPGVFVSSLGYPRVSLGPMVPAIYGDTSLLDEPEKWFGVSIDQIIRYRLSLVRGKITVRDIHAMEPDANILKLHELLLCSRPVESSMKLSRAPRSAVFSMYVPPLGPSAEMDDFRFAPTKSDRRVEKVYSDSDMDMEEGIFQLYQKGLSLNTIQKLVSLGMVGRKKSRKIVPTRWSITAVDDIIGRKLIDKIKSYPTVDTYRIYTLEVYGNNYIAIIMPTTWRFEWIEAWLPRTLWNFYSSKPYLIGDSEEFYGRKNYAVVGGCYYSARLAVAEMLAMERRQASALMLREIYPGFFAKIGVWNVRESVRAMMRSKYKSCETFTEALSYAISHLRVDFKTWYNASKLIRREMSQTKILMWCA
jgi:hypothetical protein